jgi:hypothetical protein
MELSLRLDVTKGRGHAHRAKHLFQDVREITNQQAWLILSLSFSKSFSNVRTSSIMEQSNFIKAHRVEKGTVYVYWVRK